MDRAFLEVFGVSALAGRTFYGGDFSTAATAIVDQTFVRQVAGDGPVIGRRVRPVPAPGAEPGPWYEIVGAIRPRCRAAFRRSARTSVRVLRLDDLGRLDEVLDEAQVSSSLTSYPLALVTLSVLVLSAAGLYALMSFTVTRRRREIGIRTALGATAALYLHQTMNIEVEGGWHIPGILPAAAIFIVIVGLLAAAGPARRAVRVDPTEALRDG